MMSPEHVNPPREVVLHVGKWDALEKSLVIHFAFLHGERFPYEGA